MYFFLILVVKLILFQILLTKGLRYGKPSLVSFFTEDYSQLTQRKGLYISKSMLWELTKEIC